MKIKIKSNSSGFSLPVFGLGTWLMGGRVTHDPDNNDKRDITAIQSAIASGITHIDTAESYAAGYAEKLIGQAIKEFDRTKLFIVSKVSPTHLKYQDVIKAAKNSLSRLNTDYLDLYLIHKPNLYIPIQETMKALDWLIDEGLIKNIGVSNFTVERIREAQSYTKNKIVANQVHYNLIYREPEIKGVLEYCQQNEIFLIAWRPVEQGILASPDTAILNQLAKKYNKTPAQIAVNWLISQPMVVTISTMRSKEHLKENLGALDWRISDKDIEWIRNNFPDIQKISDDVPLQ